MFEHTTGPFLELDAVFMLEWVSDTCLKTHKNIPLKNFKDHKEIIRKQNIKK